MPKRKLIFKYNDIAHKVHTQYFELITNERVTNKWEPGKNGYHSLYRPLSVACPLISFLKSYIVGNHNQKSQRQ